MLDSFATFQNEITNILKFTVHKTIRRFKKTNNIKNCSKTERPATATNSWEIIRCFEALCGESTFIRRAIEEHQISQKSMCKILKQNKFHPQNLSSTKDWIKTLFQIQINFFKCYHQGQNQVYE